MIIFFWNIFFCYWRKRVLLQYFSFASNTYRVIWRRRGHQFPWCSRCGHTHRTDGNGKDLLCIVGITILIPANVRSSLISHLTWTQVCLPLNPSSFYKSYSRKVLRWLPLLGASFSQARDRAHWCNQLTRAKLHMPIGSKREKSQGTATENAQESCFTWRKLARSGL